MVFEVDNTTEKLISELQSGIRSVIEDLERSQHEIKELLETLKLSCSDLATADQADAVGEDIAKVKSTLLKLATADQIKKYEDSFVTLLNGQTKSSALMIEVYVLDFPDKSGQPTRRGFSSKTLEHEESPFFDLIREADYHLYSPEETVARAKSRLGEEKYSLPVNNCEHFAIWCKTGIHESHQVNMWISRLSSIAHRYL